MMIVFFFFFSSKVKLTDESGQEEKGNQPEKQTRAVFSGWNQKYGDLRLSVYFQTLV